MMSLFSELILSTDEDRRGFETHPAVVAAVADGLSAERYKALLLELYHVVWQFNPVCAVAASRLGTPDRDSLQPVRHFLYEHMQAEMGHETWVLNDLQAFGVTPEAAQAHAPGVYTLALNGYNHWAASRRDPCSVLGMLYALEVIASVYGGPFASALRERLLLDGDTGVSFISSHATMDTQHMADLRSILNTLDASAALPAVAESARVNFHHFTQIMAAV